MQVSLNPADIFCPAMQTACCVGGALTTAAAPTALTILTVGVQQNYIVWSAAAE